MTARATLASVLERIAGEVSVLADGSYEVEGVRREAPPPSGEESSAEIDAVSAIGNHIYRVYHCRARDGSERAWMRPPGPDKALETRLQEANRGRGTFDYGWRVRFVEADGSLAVSKRDLTLWVPSRLFFTEDPVEEGATGSIGIPKDAPRRSPGFYLALGDVPLLRESLRSHVRIYWNVRPAGAALLMRHITERLNESEIPFNFKILNDPLAFHRADAAVLYMTRGGARAAEETLADIHRRVSRHMESPTSLFARRLGKGLAFAEEADLGVSYGQRISGSVAQGLLDSQRLGYASTEGKTAEIRRQLAVGGRDPSRPHVLMGSKDDCFVGSFA